MTKIACVIPAYNEEKLIEDTIRRTLDFWTAFDEIQFFLVVVDDGSTDKTPKILANLSDKYPNFFTLRQNNTGKGAAIRRGIEAVSNKSEVIYFIDADMPFSLTDQKYVVDKVINGAAAVYGSRVRAGGGKLQANNFLRKTASRSLIWINRLILGITIEDTQCGLKAFDASLAEKIFRELTVNSFAFDLYITVLLNKLGVEIEVVPVKLLKERRPSRVSVMKTSYRMLKDVLYIKRITNVK